MKNVLVKNSVLMVSVLFFSCHRTIEKSKIKESTKGELKKTNFSPIITNSLDSNFDFESINTQKVTEGDTVLFREWAVGVTKNISIYDNNNNIKHQFFGDSLVKYYKTGKKRFSTYRLTMLNNKNNKTFNFFSLVNYGDSVVDVYGSDENSAHTFIEKISHKKGRLIYHVRMSQDKFSADFKVNDNGIYIDKLNYLYQDNKNGHSYFYTKDTLINIKKDDFLPFDFFLNYNYLMNEKNLYKVTLDSDLKETGPKYLYRLDIKGQIIDKILYINLRYFDNKIGYTNIDKSYSIYNPWEFRIQTNLFDIGFKDKKGNCYYGEVLVDNKEIKQAFKKIYMKEPNAKIIILLKFDEFFKSVSVVLKTEKQEIRIQNIIDFSVERKKCLESHF